VTVLCVALALMAVADALSIDAVKKHRQSKRLQAKAKAPCPNFYDVKNSRNYYASDPNGKGLLFNEFAKYAGTPVNAPEIITWAKAYRDWMDLCSSELIKNGGQVKGEMRLVLTPKAYAMYETFISLQAPSATKVNVGSASLRWVNSILYPNGAKLALLPAEVDGAPLTLEMGKKVPITYLFDQIDSDTLNPQTFGGLVTRWAADVKSGTIPNTPWLNCA